VENIVVECLIGIAVHLMDILRSTVADESRILTLNVARDKEKEMKERFG
jgi:hypothetical protein